jgi:hypothetical protein
VDILSLAVLLGLDEQCIDSMYCFEDDFHIVFTSLNVPKTVITNVDNKLYLIEHIDLMGNPSTPLFINNHIHQTNTIINGI